MKIIPPPNNPLSKKEPFDAVPHDWSPASSYGGFPWRPLGTDAVIFDFEAIRNAAIRVPMRTPGIVAFTIGVYPALARHANAYGVVTDPVNVILNAFPQSSMPKKKIRAALWLLETGGVIVRRDGAQ